MTRWSASASCRATTTGTNDDEDEFFYVISGRFLIDLEGRTAELAPGQGLVVPKGVPHRPRAPEKTVILMVEGAGIVPTGDA